jgi:hypothetical protein
MIFPEHFPHENTLQPRFSVFDSSLYNVHTARRHFPQEKAALDSVRLSTYESKTR